MLPFQRAIKDSLVQGNLEPALQEAREKILITMNVDLIAKRIIVDGIYQVRVLVQPACEQMAKGDAIGWTDDDYYYYYYYGYRHNFC